MNALDLQNRIVCYISCFTLTRELLQYFKVNYNVDLYSLQIFVLKNKGNFIVVGMLFCRLAVRKSLIPPQPTEVAGPRVESSVRSASGSPRPAG